MEDELGQVKEPEAAVGYREDSALMKRRPKKGHGPRKRVSQACDRCRSRKDKCDGKKPACSTCVSNGHICSYDANVKKRGLPEGYVRGLEKLWGIAIQVTEDVEETILEALDNDKEVGEIFVNAWNDDANSEKLVNIWRTSHLSRELESLLSSTESSTDSSKRKRANPDSQSSKIADLCRPIEFKSVFQPGKEEGADSPNVGWPNKRRNIAASDELAGTPSDEVAVGSEGYVTTGSVSILTPPSGGAGAAPASNRDPPDLPPETWLLLDVYFSYSHPWFPIIEKHDILRTSYQYTQSHTLPSTSGDKAALWAVLAYTKFQHRAINHSSHVQGPAQDTAWTAEKTYSYARSLIPNEEEEWQLGHIQALLILTLSNMGIGHMDRAWFLVGQAIRMAADLGIGSPNSSDPIATSSQAMSRNKHVFLGCFILETIIAARLERRPHLRNSDVDAVGPIDEDGLDEWDPWTDCLSVRRESYETTRVPASISSTFNQLIQLLKVLNEVTCLPRDPNSLHIISKLLEKLHTWSYAQPSQLCLDSSSKTHEQARLLLPHQYHLQAMYLSTLATCQLLKYSLDREGSDMEPYILTAGQTLDLVQNHSDMFGLLIVPPTYEYFTTRAYNIINEVQRSIENTHIMVNDWRHKLDTLVEAMEPAWPTFELLRNSIASRPRSRDRQESEVAFDLIISTNQTANTPASTKPPRGPANSKNPSPRSPQPLASHGINRPSRTMNYSIIEPHQYLQPPRSLGRVSGPGLPSPPINYQDSRSALGRDTNPSQPTPMKTVGDLSKLDYASLDSLPSLDRPFPTSKPTTSENDVDALFSEFAALDATEWTGNWDQSLLNLGFTDRDNMNQDFYAFCQEPDPLHPNRVFQQLIANSNTERPDFLDGCGFAEMGVGDESEGIEAGQILQSLSVAEGQPEPVQ